MDTLWTMVITLLRQIIVENIYVNVNDIRIT